MGRPFVPDEHAAILTAFALRLALHQHLHPSRQHGDLSVLSGDRFGQVVNGAFKMGNAFFMFSHQRHPSMCRRQAGISAQS